MNRLRRFFLGNLAEKILALVLAVLIYGFVFGQRPVEQIVRVPIQIEDLPAGMVVTRLEANSVDLRLSAPKTLLVGLERKNIRAIVDLASAAPGFQTYMFRAEDFALARAISIVEISPPEISFWVDPLMTRIVPVVPTFRNRPPEGFEIVEVEVTPREIEIQGPKRDVEKLEEIPTEPIDLSTLRQDQSFSVLPGAVPAEIVMSLGGRVLVSIRVASNPR
ncbi:MAG: YbbR-like domain-containing protein [Nitrospirae bacterium]|nr:YbbR-like domain-containing protein [Nitrospirota bacterium]